MNTAAASVLFSTTLRPQRSASRRTINWLLGILTVAFTVTGLGFSLIGAWLVIGLDIALLVGAFYLNNRDSRASEQIDLTADALTIRRTDPWGRARQWSFQPQWLNIGLIKTTQGRDQLEVRSHGQSLVIGDFLSPEEREQTCEDLRQALAQTKPHQAI